MTTLHIDLLRHGETTAGKCFLGRTDAQLTPEGWQQMLNSMQGRSPDDYDLILSSPMRRCADFAREWVGDHRWRLEPRLREYDFGDWDGFTAAQIHAQSPDLLGHFWSDPWHSAPPNAEPMADFFARLTDLVELLQRGRQGRTLLICHGGVIRALRCILNGLPVGEMLAFPVEHGSLHRLQGVSR